MIGYVAAGYSVVAAAILTYTWWLLRRERGLERDPSGDPGTHR